MVSAKINLLAAWYEEAYKVSSPILIKPVIERDIVEYIYKNLLKFFGLDYFCPSHPDTSIDEINWIHSLLANKNNLGCYYALKEICDLLNYYLTVENELPQCLEQSIKDQKLLRTFLFELLVFRTFDLSGLVNKKKVIRNNQVLEGLCVINGREFLFECKKAYYPKLESLDVLVNILKTFSLKRTLFSNPAGMICLLTLQKPVQKGFKTIFKKYFPTLVKLNNLLDSTNREFNEQLEGATVTVKIFNEIDLIEAQELKSYDILFYLKKIRRLNGVHYLMGKSQLNFSLYQSDIFKKFEQILKGVKRQHKNSYKGPKIIFIDTEVYPELRMGLFQMERSLIINEIEKLVNKLGFRDSIICIIRRIINEEKLINDVYTFSSPNFRNEAQLIGRLFEKVKVVQ